MKPATLELMSSGGISLSNPKDDPAPDHAASWPASSSSGGLRTATTVCCERIRQVRSWVHQLLTATYVDELVLVLSIDGDSLEMHLVRLGHSFSDREKRIRHIKTHLTHKLNVPNAQLNAARENR